MSPDKTHEVCQKYSAARRILNSLVSVSSGDETLHLMLDILHNLSTRVSRVFSYSSLEVKLYSHCTV